MRVACRNQNIVLLWESEAVDIHALFIWHEVPFLWLVCRVLHLIVDRPHYETLVVRVSHGDQHVRIGRKLKRHDWILMAAQSVKISVRHLAGALQVCSIPSNLPDRNGRVPDWLAASCQVLTIWTVAEALKRVLTFILQELLLLVRLHAIDDHKGAGNKCNVAVQRVSAYAVLRAYRTIDEYRSVLAARLRHTYDAFNF